MKPTTAMIVAVAVTMAVATGARAQDAQIAQRRARYCTGVEQGERGWSNGQPIQLPSMPLLNACKVGSSYPVDLVGAYGECRAWDPAFWNTRITGNTCERFGLRENWERKRPAARAQEEQRAALQAENAVRDAKRKQVERALEARVKAGATPRQALDDAYDDCVSGRTPAADCPEGLSPSR